MRVIDTTIGKLRIGAPLVMGKYGVTNDAPEPILWLKGTPNGDFITKDAVDYLPFDGQERNNEENRDFRYRGNPRYLLCNLLQFLNSTEEAWYCPTHPADAPPDRGNVDWAWMQYKNHFGFLYFFEEYEVAALSTDMKTINGDTVTSIIRLPSAEDIIGTDRFKLFNKKGIRPKATDDLVYRKGQAGFDLGSYVPFWISDVAGWNANAAYISRSGAVDQMEPKSCSGVRPVCTLPLDTPITQNEDGTYRIKPSVIKVNTFTDEELFAFLGLAQP